MLQKYNYNVMYIYLTVLKNWWIITDSPLCSIKLVVWVIFISLKIQTGEMTQLIVSSVQAWKPEFRIWSPGGEINKKTKKKKTSKPQYELTRSYASISNAGQREGVGVREILRACWLARQASQWALGSVR